MESTPDTQTPVTGLPRIGDPAPQFTADTTFGTLKLEDFLESWLRILEPGAGAEYSFLFDVIKGAPEFRKGTQRDPDHPLYRIRTMWQQLLGRTICKSARP